MPTIKAVGETVAKCDWTDEMRFILIQIMTDSPSDADIGYKKSEWIKIAIEFNEQTGLNLVNSQLQSQINSLKQKFQIFAKYENNSGFGFDEKTKCVTGPEAALDSYCLAHPNAKIFRRQPFPFYEVLKDLLQGKSGVAFGTKS